MALVSFGHAGYVCSDIDRSIDFYTNVLGCKVSHEINPPNRRIVFVQFADGQAIELFSGGTEKTSHGNEYVGFLHLCLIIDNARDYLEELKGKGVEVVRERINEDGSGTFFILDPDGNELELMQRTADSKY